MELFQSVGQVTTTAVGAIVVGAVVIAFVKATGNAWRESVGHKRDNDRAVILSEIDRRLGIVRFELDSIQSGRRIGLSAVEAAAIRREHDILSDLRRWVASDQSDTSDIGVNK